MHAAWNYRREPRQSLWNEGRWQFKPRLDLGITPAADDVKAKSKAHVPEVRSQAEMKMQMARYATFDGGLSFEPAKGDVTLGRGMKSSSARAVATKGVPLIFNLA